MFMMEEELADAYGYSREGLREWLEGLPPHESFCNMGKCPIATWLGITNVRAMALDSDLTHRIDYLPHHWHELTPAEVLSALDYVEGKSS